MDSSDALSRSRYRERRLNNKKLSCRREGARVPYRWKFCCYSRSFEITPFSKCM